MWFIPEAAPEKLEPVVQGVNLGLPPVVIMLISGGSSNLKLERRDLG